MKMYLFLIAVLLFGTCSLSAQEDPNVMWTYNNASFSTYPAVHPNGNVLIGDKSKGDVIELNGLTGELIRRISVPVSDIDPNQIAISKDGTRLTIAKKVVDYATGSVIAELPEITVLPKFLNPSNNILVLGIYSQGQNSWLVYNVNDGTSTGYKIPHLVTSIDVSNDGRFLAVASKETSLPINEQRTHFYLYNAQTMQLIRELENVLAEGRTIEFIQFSENAKYVGYGHKFGGTPKGTFFNCETPYTKWENVNYPIDSRSISFIKDEYAIICAGGAALIFDINSSKSIYRTIIYAAQFQIFFNKIYNSLITINSQTLALTSLNYDIILSVDNEINKPNITFEYLNGILKISGFESNSPIINITISDTLGNIMFNNQAQSMNGRIELAVSLPSGVYILQIRDGNNNYSQKFIVTR